MSKWAANTNHRFLNLPDTTLHTYNAHDAYWTAKLLPRIRAELQGPRFSPAQWQWHTDVIQPLQWAVIDMRRRGLRVDVAARSRFTAQLRRELHEIDNSLRAEATTRGFPFTDKFPNSDTQVAKFLYGPPSEGGCGLKCHKFTEKTRRPSADLDALLRCLKKLRKMDEHARQILFDLCHRSRLQTMLERYTGFEVDRDGRVRAQVKMAHAKTWRFAYAEPALQQFPPETRFYFVATPGKLLLTADYSQLEARWLAILSHDTVSLEAFEAGRDIHAQNLCDLMGYSDAEWEALEAGLRKKSRYFAKGFLYRISYGGEGSVEKNKAFCPCPRCVEFVPQTLALKRQEILDAEARWFRAHHAVRRFHTDLINGVKRQGYYETPFGVRRYFAKTWGSDFERELKNAPMQTCSALLMNQRQVRLHRMGAPIVLQHHDSFMLEVDESPGRLVDQWAADLRGTMEDPLPEVTLDGKPVSFPTDCEVGKNWGSHSPGNPDGLQSFDAK